MLFKFFPPTHLPKISVAYELKSHLGTTEKIARIDNHENYYVTSYGRVFKSKTITKTGRVSKARFLTHTARSRTKPSIIPYQIVKLPDSNHHFITYPVHRLVAKYFCPNNGHDIVNHIDCDYNNNYYLNLEWCTTLHNNRNSSQNVINERIAQEIRVYYIMSGDSIRGTGRAFSLPESSVRGILSNQRWHDANWCHITRRFV